MKRLRVRGRIRAKQLLLYPITYGTDLETVGPSIYRRYTLRVEYNNGRPMRAELVPEIAGYPSFTLDRRHLDWAGELDGKRRRMWWWADEIERRNVSRDLAMDHGLDAAQVEELKKTYARLDRARDERGSR